MLLDCLVEEIGQDGAAKMSATISSLTASVHSISVKASYDSQKDSTPASGATGRQASFRRALSALIGRKYSAQIDSTGRVVKLIDVDPLIARAASGDGDATLEGGQLAVLLAEQNLRDYVAPAFFAGLPPRPIAPGDSWTATQLVRIPRSFAVRAKRNYNLDGYRLHDGKKAAVIDYRGYLTDKMTVPIGPQQFKLAHGGGLEIVQVGGKGRIVFSVASGELITWTDYVAAEVRPVIPAGRGKAGKDGFSSFYDIKRTIRATSGPRQ